MKVKVYSTQACPFCQDAKDFLKKNKIKFEKVDVNEDRKAALEMISKSKQTGVPVIEIGKEIIVGFDVPKIKKALKLK